MRACARARVCVCVCVFVRAAYVSVCVCVCVCVCFARLFALMLTILFFLYFLLSVPPSPSAPPPPSAASALVQKCFEEYFRYVNSQNDHYGSHVRLFRLSTTYMFLPKFFCFSFNLSLLSLIFVSLHTCYHSPNS